MRKLFLTSVKLDGLLEVITDEPAKVRIAFVATAADPYEDKWFIEADRKKLSEMGFQPIEIDLKGKTKKELFGILKDMDVIYIAGGNTFYLLEKVRESGFDQIVQTLLDSGIIYAGASAGAVLAGPTIEPIRALDDPSKATGLKSYEGLGLINFVVLPHYGKEKYKEKFKKIMSEFGSRGFKLIPLTDEQSIIVENDSHRIVE